MSTLSQFFASGTGGDQLKASFFKLFTSTGNMSIPSTAQYVAYAAVGGGGGSASTGSPVPNQTAGGGAGFSYYDGTFNCGAVTFCAVVGAGGAPGACTNGGTGGVSCASGICNATLVACGGSGGCCCLCGSGCFTRPGNGGTSSGGIINTCGGAGGCGGNAFPDSYRYASGGGGGAGGLLSNGMSGGNSTCCSNVIYSSSSMICGFRFDNQYGTSAGSPSHMGAQGGGGSGSGGGGGGTCGPAGAGLYGSPYGTSCGSVGGGGSGRVAQYTTVGGRYSQVKTYVGAAGNGGTQMINIAGGARIAPEPGGGGGGGGPNCAQDGGFMGGGGGQYGTNLGGNGGFGGGGGGAHQGECCKGGNGGDGFVAVEYWIE